MARAIVVEQHGGPEVLRAGAHDPGRPGPGQVRLRVERAGVNFIDTYHRTGLYPLTTPFVPGMEAAGRVEQLGPDVEGLEEGRLVAVTDVLGCYAEAVVAPADRVVAVPDGVEAREAAAAMLQGCTAHYLATSVGRLARGTTCLVHAPAGGVGGLLCQMAAAAGATVLGTTSTEHKADVARQAGCAHVRVGGPDGLADWVAEVTGGRGVDVVFDGVGQPTVDASLASLRPRGLLCSFGNAGGPVADLPPSRLAEAGSLWLTRPSLGHYLADRAELVWRAGQVLAMVADGRLRLRIDDELDLAEAGEAHRRLEGRQTAGKLLLAC